MDSKELSKILEHAAKEKHAGETVAPKGRTTSVKIEGDEESEEKKEEEPDPFDDIFKIFNRER